MALTLGLGCASASAQVNTFTDEAGDATLRKTVSATVPPGATLPDLLTLELSGWQSPTPFANPFAGQVASWQTQKLFRLRMVFDGLVNPPGPASASAFEHDPYLFGPSPLFGYVEINIDDHEDSGGELVPDANTRYLANVSRFGRTPYSRFGSSAANGSVVSQAPTGSLQPFGQSGAEFFMGLCGCWGSVTVLSGDTNFNGVFDAGETWVIRGPFIERARGFRQYSTTFGGAGGLLGIGLYDPLVRLQFSHEISTDTTSVTLVWALDQQGAQALQGLGSVPPINTNVGDGVSVEEAMQDVINLMNAGTVPFGTPQHTLMDRWKGEKIEEFLDPTDWEVCAIVGTSYLEPTAERFAWTDTGFYETHADCDGDGLANAADRLLLRDRVYLLDGTSEDGDGVTNGAVVLVGTPLNFDLYDLDGNGVIDGDDLWAYGHRADVNGDGLLNIFDYITFSNMYAANHPEADFDLNGIRNIFDYIAFSNAYSR